MTLSKKYNEIMDKVVVTDEMRSRVLREISSADPERLAAYKMDTDGDLSKAFSGRRRYPASKILAGLAVACALILIAGIIRISLPVMSPSTAGGTVYEEAAEFSAEGAEADTMVGNQDTGGQTALQSSEKTDEAAANGAVEAAGSGAAGAKGEAGGENFGAKAEAAGGGAAGPAADEAGNETATEEAASDRADMSVRLGEPEIRKIVEEYIGPEHQISETTVEESALIYTVSDVQTGEVFSYIRIDVVSGDVEIEDAQTKEVSICTFRDLTGQ